MGVPCPAGNSFIVAATYNLEHTGPYNHHVHNAVAVRTKKSNVKYTCSQVLSSHNKLVTELWYTVSPA